MSLLIICSICKGERNKERNVTFISHVHRKSDKNMQICTFTQIYIPKFAYFATRVNPVFSMAYFSFFPNINAEISNL